MIVSDDVID